LIRDGLCDIVRDVWQSIRVEGTPLERWQAKARRLLNEVELNLKHVLNERLAELLREEELKWYQRAKVKHLLAELHLPDDFL
jgi:hypothetical protein